MLIENYIKVINKLCLYYNGHNAEYLIQLKALRPSLNKNLPGIEITYACKECYLSWLEDDPLSIGIEKLENNNYAYSIPIVYDARTEMHPILNLIKESDIVVDKIKAHEPGNQVGIICPDGSFPTKSLTAEQINYLKSWIVSKGLKPMVVGNEDKRSLAKSSGMIVGVECDLLYEALAKGTPTALVPTGIGTELYKRMVESPIILNI